MGAETPAYDATQAQLAAPFPWFGGKSRAASLIWQALGAVPNYVEPFAGSLAALLARPHAPGIETVNDIDGFICNVWRALASNPDAVACWADWPAHECDLHARHAWLVARRAVLTRQLEGDPDYYDAKIAGWWLWGIANWIGGGWCSGQGPWQVCEGEDGTRRLLHLGNAGQGVQRRRPHLGDWQGVNRKRLHLGNAGRGEALLGYCRALAARLARVRVCCGDWTRVLGPTVTWQNGLTGIVLDPPYAHAERDAHIYACEADISAAVRDWAIAHGGHPLLRIVLCGYDTEHAMPPTWRAVPWTAGRGMSNLRKTGQNHNRFRETLWLSPHCLAETQLGLFESTR